MMLMLWSPNCQLNVHTECDGFFEKELIDNTWERVACQCRCHIKDRVPDLIAA